MKTSFGRSLLGGASLSVMIALGLAAPSWAQDGIPDDNETITVIGQRAMIANSLETQRNSDTVESVLTRDAIGQFPDQNVAEAVRRLTGINVIDDQGEGRFLSVRGLNPALNSSAVNGVRLPAPEKAERAVALDVIASELVQSIEVKKTLTPDMDGDTIGASIEINTTRAFDRPDLFLSGTIEGSYNDLNEEVSPKGALDFSIPITENFGIAGGFSYYDRKTSTDNTEMDDWGVSERPGSEGVVYADTLEYRDYDVERERRGASLSFDWRPADSTTLYARLLYSTFDDTERRGRLTFKLDGEPVSGDDNTALFVAQPDKPAADGDPPRERLRVRRDLKDRFEGQVIQSYQVGGQTLVGPWDVTYQLAYSEAEEHEHRTQDPTRFVYGVDTAGALAVLFDYSDINTSAYTITAGEAGFLDPSGYEFTELDITNGLSQDEEWAGRFDVARDFNFASGLLTLQGGVKLRDREKTFSADNLIYDEFNGSYTLADVAGGQTYGLADISPLPDLGLVRAFNHDNLAGFELNPDDSLLDSMSDAYDVQEDISAAYAMGTYVTGPWTVVAGARVEHTEDDLAGNLVDEDAVTITPVSFSNSYTDVLPSVNVRYDASDDVVLRAAAYASLARPGIGDLAPRTAINEDLEAEFGNPDLDPYHVLNFDLSAEYYFAPTSVVQVGVFYKDIEDFIVPQHYDAGDAPYMGSFNGVTFSEATIPINGESASVAGIEFNYQQAFTSLPSPFDGLLAGFNYTYTDAEGELPLSGGGSRSIPLIESAKNTYNAMVGYEAGPISLRLTAAYRDKYLEEPGGEDDGSEDRYADDHLQIDASAKYTINDHAQIYAEFVNLNDEPYLAYQPGPGRNRLLQYESYSWTGKFGLRLTY